MLTLTFIIDPNGAGNHSVEMATSTTLLRARELIDRELEHRAIAERQARREHWSMKEAQAAASLMEAAREGRASFSEAMAATRRCKDNGAHHKDCQSRIDQKGFDPLPCTCGADSDDPDYGF